MSDDFWRRLHRAKRCSVLWSLLSLTAVVCPIASIGVGTVNLKAGIILAFLSVVPIGLICVIIHKQKSYRPCGEVCRLPILRFHTYEEIIQEVCGGLPSEDIGITSAEQNGVIVKLIVQRGGGTFSSRDLAKRRHQVSARITKEGSGQAAYGTFEAAKRACIHLVVCDAYDAALLPWLTDHAEHNLERVEGLLNAAVVLDRQECLLPYCPIGITGVEIRKYLAAVELIARIFCDGSEGEE